MTNALAEIFPNHPPRFLARPPHGYHDTALIRDELESEGFSGVTIATRAEQSRAPSPRLPAIAYCQGTLRRNKIEAGAPGTLEAATDYATSAIANKHGSGEVAVEIQAHVVVAVAWRSEFDMRCRRPRPRGANLKSESSARIDIWQRPLCFQHSRESLPDRPRMVE